MFRQRLWMIPIGQWVGYLGAALALWALWEGVSAWWLLAWAAGHVLGGLAISVALHRYFTHGAFTTTPFWHVAMALASCIVLQGSPLAWAAAHQTHHTYADGAGDPHDTRAWYLVWKTYRDVPMVRWRLRALVEDGVLTFVHRNALLVVLGWALTLLQIGLFTGTGLAPLVFGYLAPMGTVQLVGAVHQVVSHRGGSARDLQWLEWLLPAAGEWSHGYHHHFPRHARLGWRWWHLDYGWWFIRAIRT